MKDFADNWIRQDLDQTTIITGDNILQVDLQDLAWFMASNGSHGMIISLLMGDCRWYFESEKLSLFWCMIVWLFSN